jgi:NADH dehydrogenase [ubiquinone] 1 alpha subcomplex assembly factor 6
LVRREDPDRFQTVLFAPAGRREALFALYAFNYEIARVREVASEPTLGRIRLQWWRENIAAAFEGAAPRRQFVVEALNAAIRGYGLTRAHFDRLIDTREQDLDPEPPASLAALEAYAEGTSAPLVYLALQILAAVQTTAIKAARHAGIAYALSGLLRAIPFHARSGRCTIPAELAVRTGLDPRDYAELRTSPALCCAVAIIAEVAAQHLVSARAHRRAIPRDALPALLPAIVADRALVRLRRAGFDPFSRDNGADPLQSWRLAAAALLRRF